MKNMLIMASTMFAAFSTFSCNDHIADMYMQQKLSEGVVAYWPITGSSYVTQDDYSGNGYDLVIQNGNTANIVPGKFSTALNFNYTSMRGLCSPGSAVIFPESDAVTVSIWVLFNSSTGGLERLVDNNGLYLTMYDAQIFFAGPDWTSQSPRFDMIPGKWYHIVGIYNRKTVRLYVNGELFGSSNSLTTDPVPESSFYWVKSNAGGWSGILDEIRIYNRELSEDEISALMETGRE